VVNESLLCLSFGLRRSSLKEKNKARQAAKDAWNKRMRQPPFPGVLAREQVFFFFGSVPILHEAVKPFELHEFR
jgi:hypothetical protein